ncbi:hypothetical protein FACS1894130_13050 [Spirochaetia bacterium]|nr:hypothetical protein FACS1894130_13050 [Spirochaetia bacterium]
MDRGRVVAVPSGGQRALTRWKCLKAGSGYSLLSRTGHRSA